MAEETQGEVAFVRSHVFVRCSWLFTTNGVAANREELLRYGLSEEIIHYKRRWFVVKDDALEMLVQLLPQRKPVKDLTVADETPDEPTESE